MQLSFEGEGMNTMKWYPRIVDGIIGVHSSQLCTPSARARTAESSPLYATAKI